VVRCAIPNCAKPGKHRLGIRCRVMEEPSPIAGKGKTDALWSVESDAYLCDTHALSGIDITLLLEPTTAKQVSVRVVGPPGAQPRRLPIKL
jgi:hypothetical protein